MTIEFKNLVRGKIYKHETKGLSKFIATDPDDGACLIMEEFDREDGEICHYFNCERQELTEFNLEDLDDGIDLGHVDCPGCQVCLDNMRIQLKR